MSLGPLHPAQLIARRTAAIQHCGLHAKRHRLWQGGRFRYVEIARKGYEALNAALKGDFQPALERFCDPHVVLAPSGIPPESSEMHGHDGVLRFVTLQMEAFEDFSIESLEFIHAGDKVVVSVRFGGRASYTGLEVQFEVVHVCTARN